MWREVSQAAFPQGILALLALTACDALDTLDPTPPGDGAQVAGDLALASGMEIGIVSTGLVGLLRPRQADPDVPGGGILVTVHEVDAGHRATIRWRRTVEREASGAPPTPMVGIGTPQPTPATEVVTLEGTITATGLGQSRRPLIPFYWDWEQPDVATDTSLMWVSREALQELKETCRTRWSRDVLTTLSRLPEAALERIRENTRDREVYLNAAEADFVDFRLRVDGQQATIQTIRAFDDFGNEYVILADEANPLVVRFTFDVVATGAIGIDAGIWALIKATYSGYQVAEINRP
jgi:hypothetical protein